MSSDFQTSSRTNKLADSKRGNGLIFKLKAGPAKIKYLPQVYGKSMADPYSSTIWSQF